MQPITLIYTHNLRGQIDLLPRLYTFIRRLRRDYDDVVLLDMGGSCAPDAWHCAATGGRSMLIALDAMGFAAANVVGLLSDAARARLPETLALALVDAEQQWERPDLLVTAARAESDKLQVVMQPGATAHLEGDEFYPQVLEAGALGVAVIGRFDAAAELFAHAVHPLPADARPDPTIAGAVEFVLSEARYYAGRGS